MRTNQSKASRTPDVESFAYPSQIRTPQAECVRDNRLEACVRALMLLVVVVLLASPPRALANGLDNWHWRNPMPFANSLRSICFGAGKFVAVGDGGMIHTSPDGLVWDDGRRPLTTILRKVIYANGQFVAVGHEGVIVSSPDGTLWTSRASNTTNSLHAVAFGNGKYVACGKDGQLAISNDGVTWLPHSVGTANLDWITFGSGVFVTESPNAAGDLHAVRVSTDGLTWTSAIFPATPSHPLAPNEVIEVTFANGMFVASTGVSSSGFPPRLKFRWYTSSDGTNWTAGADVGEFGYGVGLGGHRFLTFANDAFIESFFIDFSRFAYTTNGSDYALVARPNDSDEATGIAYGSGQYVLAALNGKVWTSTTGKSWTQSYGGLRTDIRRVIWGAGKYLAVANGGQILTSSDGTSFAAVPASPSLAYGDIAFDGSNYVAVAAGGALYSSGDVAGWTQRNSNTGNDLLAMTRGPARWVAVGRNGTIITSPSTLAWTLRNSGTANNLNGVAYGGGIYVAVGNGGTIVTSEDGTAWDVQFTETTQTLLSARYLDGKFFAVGENGTILSSPDGATWQTQISGTARVLRDICFGNGRLVVCGFDHYAQGSLSPVNLLLQSTNGVDWENITTKIPAYVGLNSTSFLEGSFWVCGQNGAILQSDSTNGLPRLAVSMLPGNTAFQLKITLNAPGAYRIQAATNLQANFWQDVANISNAVSPFIWTDNAPTFPPRFYRVVSP